MPAGAVGEMCIRDRLAAALALGACGVQVGTCLLVSEECPIHENYKAALLHAKDLSLLHICSGLAPADIAGCGCATLSAPDATPSVACQVQAALGLPENRPALDINAACSGCLLYTSRCV